MGLLKLMTHTSSIALQKLNFLCCKCKNQDCRISVKLNIDSIIQPQWTPHISVSHSTL